MAKRYVVELTPLERKILQDLISKGRTSAMKQKRARILLKADVGPEGPGWTDQQIADNLEVGLRTVERTRRLLVEHGLEKTLERRRSPRPPSELLLDGAKEAQLIAIACGEPPEGYARWTLRLLADRFVELGYVENISHEAVRQALKKNDIRPHLQQCWVIPPEKNGEFVWHMEDVLDVYHRPRDERFPLVCMDEMSKQLTKEVREPLPAQPGRPQRYDSEYKRNGVANLFVGFAPLEGWRCLEVTQRRARPDWAHFVRDLVDKHFPKAEKIVLVMDNLNTHTGGSLYEAFPPEEAQRILERLEIHYTPKHGSWLNMAEGEFSVLHRQCLDRRVPDMETLRREVGAWQSERNAKKVGADWQFTTADARIKLRKLYPSFSTAEVGSGGPAPHQG